MDSRITFSLANIKRCRYYLWHFPQSKKAAPSEFLKKPFVSIRPLWQYPGLSN
jgi:hypothetical protein